MAKLIPCSFVFILSSSILVMTNDGSVFSDGLSTRSRWIVDERGHRVKLACANWPSHLQPVVAEGLHKQPMDSISERIRFMGFNCVRFTWPLELMTNDTLAFHVTVTQSFQRYRLFQELDGIRRHNPSILHLPLFNAFEAVVSSMGRYGVMVILDNHKTVPGWCCGNHDPDAFFGDPEFDPNLWILGLKKMAASFRNVKNVIGMSLRNELRGPKEYPHVWYKYMQQGAEAVHASNPNVLVILSGINFDTDLSFLEHLPVHVSFKSKLVFELHWYSFSDGRGSWRSHNLNDFCAKILGKVRNNGGFLLEKGFPLFLSEFGTNQGGGDGDGNRYMNCMLGWAAEKDVDWAIWALAGDYYLRQGKRGLVETYGMLNPNWHHIHNSTFLRRISVIQPPYKGPGVSHNQHNRIFHPLTGFCVVRNSRKRRSELTLGPCGRHEPWSYNGHIGTLVMKDHRSVLCLEGDVTGGRRVKLGKKCSKIERVSASKMHLSFKTRLGSSLCLDVDSMNNVVANPCKCLSKDASCDPTSQWFKIL
ncbi:PREDICTED: uncharacterized protein LOC104820833 [Tarenaya hassleriana]|uniref:uncharacterized protein LOC104820833 n=1 Tax=Tarenaya hassleriana TaxID=28532 RepID=UPI00053C9BFC|nr:PREDICTED: uncharacterized protein LOC104820833 [Tarenaya hassleriana]